MATIKTQRNKQLEANLDDILKIRVFLEGNKTALGKFLTRSETESLANQPAAKAYQRRLNALKYTNHFRRLKKIHIGHLAQEVSVGGAEGQPWDDLLANITGYGDTLERFSRDIICEMLEIGYCGVLVDAPAHVSDDKESATIRNERSYSTLFKAEEIYDFQIGTKGAERGQLMSCLLAQPMVISEQGEKLRSALRYEQLAGSVAWYLLQEQKGKNNDDEHITWEVIDEGTLQIAAIPFVLFNKDLDEGVLLPALNNVENLLNKQSYLDNILHHQAFRRTVAFGVQAEELKFLAENIIATVGDPGGSITELQEADPQALEREVARLEKEIQRTILLEHHQLSDDTKQVQSAQSKAKDFLAREQYYHDLCDLVEDCLSKVLGFHGQLEGVQAEDINVKLSRDFGLSDELELLAKRQSINNLARELGVTAVQKALLKLDVEEMVLPTSGEQSEEDYRAELIAEVDSAQAVSTRAEQDAVVRPTLAGLFN